MEKSEEPTKGSSLFNEINTFAETLPYWGKYFASLILRNSTITEENIEKAYGFLLEELGLVKPTEKETIEFRIESETDSFYKNLKLEQISNVQGVNALAEGYSIELHPNLTVLFGANGSGKSGYVRLLKQVFHNRFNESIEPNIHIEARKDPKALFTFNTGKKHELKFPEDRENSIFNQFAIFDGKSAQVYLTKKNEFNFRPSGLNFFGELNIAVAKLEEKLNLEITKNTIENNLTILFEGDSEVKTLINNLSEKTTKEDVFKYVPFSEEDEKQKKQLEVQHEDLKLKAANVEKELKVLDQIAQLISETKKNIISINGLISDEKIGIINSLITNLNEVEKRLRTEGISNFSNKNINEIGSTEWKDFIIAAQKFATKHNPEGEYPRDEDICVFCHQPLSPEAKALIEKYWVFTKSEAEELVKSLSLKLSSTKQEYEKINFSLIPDGSILKDWLAKNKNESLNLLLQEIEKAKSICNRIIENLTNRIIVSEPGYSIPTNVFDELDSFIQKNQETIRNNELVSKINDLASSIRLLKHKETLNNQLEKVRKIIQSKKWIARAQECKFPKKSITDTEKLLSTKYFNQKYVDTFNGICKELEGEFGISIAHTGSGGVSYRQLKLKGKDPSVILSEGEQKVIALADFLAELSLSENNKGLIFDDPVNSLDDDRKEIIAKKIAKEAASKQVIVFTHDKPFFHHLTNAAEATSIEYMNHVIECIGKVYPNNSPKIEKQYASTTIPETFYKQSLSADPQKRSVLLSQGFAALATCYEHFLKNTILKSIISPFDKHIRFTRIKEIKISQDYSDRLVNQYGIVCDLKEGHLPTDGFSSKEITSDQLDKEIKALNALKEEYKTL